MSHLGKGDIILGQQVSTAHHSNGLVSQSNIPVEAIHENLGQEVIITTQDKLKLALGEYKSTVEGRKEWQTPANFLLSLIIALFTCDFKPIAGLDKQTITGFFYCATSICLVYLIRAIIKKPNEITIEQLIRKIANNK